MLSRLPDQGDWEFCWQGMKWTACFSNLGLSGNFCFSFWQQNAPHINPFPGKPAKSLNGGERDQIKTNIEMEIKLLSVKETASHCGFASRIVIISHAFRSELWDEIQPLEQSI